MQLSIVEGLGCIFLKSFHYIFRMKYKNVNRLLNKSFKLLSTRLYTTFENRNFVSKLEERGLLTSIFPNKSKELVDSLASKTHSVYCGFDPTASSLHVGNLLGLIALIHCQRSGHTPIALVGSATALIGDPSGRTTARKQLDSKEVVENSKKIEESIIKIFRNHENYIWKKSAREQIPNKELKLPELKLLNNIKWYENVNLIQFLSKFGYHLRMSDLLSRKQIQSRLSTTEGISFTEFFYQILQAYDWLYLLENHDCRLQIGGNDQTGNITTGYELIDKLKPNSRVFGLTLPLLTNKTGEKIGKSTGNAIWLDESQQSTFEFYQFFLNTSDQLVETYLKLFTFLSLSEIQDLMEKHKRNPENYAAQKKLAEQITILVRGEDGFNSAVKCTKALFGNDVEALSLLNDSELDSTFKSSKVNRLVFRKDMRILELVLDARIFPSIDEAKRIITEGGFSINYVKIKDPAMILDPNQHILKNNFTLIKTGKKNFHIIKWIF